MYYQNTASEKKIKHNNFLEIDTISNLFDGYLLSTYNFIGYIVIFICILISMWVRSDWF